MHQGKTFLDKSTFGTNLFLHIISLMPKIINIFKELKLLRIYFYTINDKNAFIDLYTKYILFI